MMTTMAMTMTTTVIWRRIGRNLYVISRIAKDEDDQSEDNQIDDDHDRNDDGYYSNMEKDWK